MTEQGQRELSSRVIEAAIAVHKALGPGFLESVYENALCIELRLMGLDFEQQKWVGVFCEGEVVGQHRLALLVEGVFLV